MQKKAVIFDMDGVLIDSEPFWQQAQIDIMAEFGVHITSIDCLQTMGLRIDALVTYWYQKFNLQGPGIAVTTEHIVDRVIERIHAQGLAKPGVRHALELIAAKGLTIGLATSSPLRLADVVLDKLAIKSFFTHYHSAEHEAYGKPHPAVYLSTAEELGYTPAECIAIEDSFNGLLAAKSATMKTIVIPEAAHADDPRFSIADIQLHSLDELQRSHLD